MTPKELIAKARELSSKTTQGPWKEIDADGGMITVRLKSGWDTLDLQDYAFISESRTLLPKAIARIEKL